MNTFESPPNKEVSETLLFKVTLMRHEEPYYKDEGHDLTPRGAKNAETAGKKLRESGQITDGDDLILFHSPKPRAEGTLDFLTEGAKIPNGFKRSIRQLRASDIPDRKRFEERLAELEYDTEAVARDHHKNPALYENDPSFIEPTSKKKKRLYRSLEYLIRAIEKNNSEDTSAPHIIAVSHYEIITNLLDDVFGIENIGRYNAPDFGESVSIEAYAQEDNKDTIRLKISFQKHEKEVLFDRRDRSIKPIEKI